MLQPDFQRLSFNFQNLKDAYNDMEVEIIEENLSSSENDEKSDDDKQG